MSSFNKVQLLLLCSYVTVSFEIDVKSQNNVNKDVSHMVFLWLYAEWNLIRLWFLNVYHFMQNTLSKSAKEIQACKDAISGIGSFYAGHACGVLTFLALVCPAVPRWASPRTTAVMDEMDLPQMKKEVESLKYQLAFKREKSSKTVTEWVPLLTWSFI